MPGFPQLARPQYGWLGPLPPAPWLCPCPSPSAPAHRARSSPGPSSPSGPLRSGETKAAVSQSGAGDLPALPWASLILTRQLCSPTPPPPTLPADHGFRFFEGSPPDGTHRQACEREGSLFRGSSETSRPPNCQFSLPTSRHRTLPTSQTRPPQGPAQALSQLACRQAGPASHLSFPSHSRMGLSLRTVARKDTKGSSGSWSTCHHSPQGPPPSPRTPKRSIPQRPPGALYLHQASLIWELTWLRVVLP